MNDLYDHICRKCPHGIPYSEAVKLMLTLYCTLAILPKEFQNLPLSKIELAKLFSKLAASGKIVPDEVTSVIPFNLTQPDYWEDLASKLFRGDIAPDYSFPSRASKFV